MYDNLTFFEYYVTSLFQVFYVVLDALETLTSNKVFLLTLL